MAALLRQEWGAWPNGDSKMWFYSWKKKTNQTKPQHHTHTPQTKHIPHVSKQTKEELQDVLSSLLSAPVLLSFKWGVCFFKSTSSSLGLLSLDLQALVHFSLNTEQGTPSYLDTFEKFTLNTFF